MTPIENLSMAVSKLFVGCSVSDVVESFLQYHPEVLFNCAKSNQDQLERSRLFVVVANLVAEIQGRPERYEPVKALPPMERRKNKAEW